MCELKIKKSNVQNDPEDSREKIRLRVKNRRMKS